MARSVKARGVERRADGRHHAVHHAAGRDDVGPRAGVGHRHPAQDLERRVVVHRALAEEAAVPMAGVLAAADVGHEQQLGVSRPEPAERLLDDPVLREVLRPDLVLGRRKPEHQDSADAERDDAVRLAVERVVYREVADSRHRGNRALDAIAVHHEERLNQVGRMKTMFADEPAECGGAAAPARPMERGVVTEGRLESPWHRRKETA